MDDIGSPESYMRFLMIEKECITLEALRRGYNEYQQPRSIYKLILTREKGCPKRNVNKNLFIGTGQTGQENI